MTIKLLSFDIDGTLLENEAHPSRLLALWPEQAQENRPLLCINTGRLLDDTRGLIEAGKLPLADYLITGVGTHIYDMQAQKPLTAFLESLDAGWNLAQVEKILLNSPLASALEKQPARFQNAHKSSWFLASASPEQINALKQRFDEAGLKVAIIYSSALHLDILPHLANKGNALRWLCQHLNIPCNRVLVAGDTGNDSAMFQVEGVRGIVVANAQPELRQATQRLPVYVAQSPADAGVIEGLKYYGVLSAD